ncbi:carbohydrate kinase family protein [Nocardioides marmorisolisilvae]|uniref:Carbohydrate kinase n=1 Tax=Nocardioides marmorisolisilvae TaxID=1542737 RepID=A0A3N0DS65_9ACTN|nr:carbohydrate kinase family protein [Nocardioides marmorisolisilvae]RNL78460.1 carbohydrate kinase [Nocardioides marmorisolisilvae]
MSGTVVVVGGINLDTLARIEADTVRGSSNPGRTVTAPGGVGRNVAENLARLGSPVTLVGTVGRDHAGDLLLQALGRHDIDTSRVQRHRTIRTGTYTAVLTSTGDLDIGVADMAATESIVPADLGGSLLADASWLVLDGNLRTDTIAHGLRLAAAAGVPVALDPVGVAKAARLGPIPGVHTFTPNAAELAAWAGTEDIYEAIAAAFAQDIQALWLRAGAAGSTIHRPDQDAVTIALNPAEVVDVTGAGDAMLAAYVHRMSQGDDVETATWFATAAAWLTVQSPSAVRDDLTEALVTKTLEEQR